MKLHDLKVNFTQTIKKKIKFRESIILGWPTHKNAGDHVIAISTLLFLHNELGVTPQIASLSYNQARRSLCPIIFLGGGNLGDIWEREQDYKEKIIQSNPKRKIVIFPQTIQFYDDNRLRKAKSIFNNANVKLFTREETSQDIANIHFRGCTPELAPDTVFYAYKELRDLAQGRQYIARCDKEAIHPKEDKDWNKIIFSLSGIVLRTKSLLAMQSLAITAGAVCQISNAEKIVTNRLHAHILACILKKETAIIPNNYHKNSSFFHTWTSKLEKTSLLNGDNIENIE